VKKKHIKETKCLKILKYLEGRGHNTKNAYKYALINNNLPLIKYLEKRDLKPKIQYAFEHYNKKTVKYIRQQIKLRLNRMRMIFIFGGPKQ
jgi:hypothetical protein